MRKLIIDKFGPVEHSEIEIKKVNLFIGKQSIGKSTIAKLITILTDHINLIMLIDGGHNAWRMLLDEYSLSAYLVNQNYRIEYYVAENQYELQMNIDRNKLSVDGKVKGKKVDNRILANAVFISKPIFHNDELVKQLLHMRLKDGESLKKTVELMKDSLYIPAERNVVSVVSKLQAAIMLSDSIVPKTLLRFILELNNARESQAKWDVPLLDISYVWENNEDYFVMDGRKSKMPLRVASSGIQSLLPLYIVLKYALAKKEYSSYVIEEPECNLFPDKQIALLNFLVKAVDNELMTLTITTHSPYLLSAMNNYLFAGELIKKYAVKAKDAIKDRLGEYPAINAEELSVYSLGDDINPNKVYCESILDEKSGMISANSLDGISVMMGNDFDKLDEISFELNSDTDA